MAAQWVLHVCQCLFKALCSSFSHLSGTGWRRRKQAARHGDWSVATPTHTLHGCTLWFSHEPLHHVRSVVVKYEKPNFQICSTFQFSGSLGHEPCQQIWQPKWFKNPGQSHSLIHLVFHSFINSFIQVCHRYYQEAWSAPQTCWLCMQNLTFDFLHVRKL